jgi:thioredoxin-related protein
MKNWMLGLILLGTSVASAQEWRTNLDDAVTEAGKNGKLVFLLFSLPDACDVCERFEKNVIASQTFVDFAKNNYVLARPDFGETASFEAKADNLLIVEKYNKDGFFPWVVVLDGNAKVLGKMGLYNDETPEAYIGKLQTITKR